MVGAVIHGACSFAAGLGLHPSTLFSFPSRYPRPGTPGSPLGRVYLAHPTQLRCNVFFFEKPLLIKGVSCVTFVVSSLVFRNTRCVTGFSVLLLCAASRVTQRVTRATSVSGTDCASSGTSAALHKRASFKASGHQFAINCTGTFACEISGKKCRKLSGVFASN